MSGQVTDPTIATLDVPPEAMAVAWRAFIAHDDQAIALADAITAAAPIIVATELRRLVEKFGWEADNQVLDQRADDLDPPRSVTTPGT